MLTLHRKHDAAIVVAVVSSIAVVVVVADAGNHAGDAGVLMYQ